MPVYSSHLLGYPDLRVGERIRQRRQESGLSLRQFAGMVGISIARLSEIENGLHVVDLKQAEAIAAALRVPLSFLIPSDVRMPFQVTREADIRAREPREVPVFSVGGVQDKHHNVIWPLAELFIGRHLEPVFARVMPSEDPPRFWSHHDEEFFFVLSGAVEFLLKTPEGLRREEVGRGDCVYFRSSLPHCLRSTRSEPAEIIDVFGAFTAPLETGFDWLAYGRSSFVLEDADAVGPPRPGERLRRLREMHGWTIRQVSSVIGTSERQLQRIEDGERAVPLDAMLRLARAFGRPLQDLVSGRPEPPYYFVQRTTEMGSVPRRARQTPVEQPHAPASKTCQPLASGFPTRCMYPYFITLRDAADETLVAHEHHSHEFIYVLGGELEVSSLSGDREIREVLQAGDCCYLDSTVPHLARGRTRNPYAETAAEVIDIFWSPLGEKYLFSWDDVTPAVVPGGAIAIAR
jgi:transcriptional regulator with XRE-family HTH domain